MEHVFEVDYEAFKGLEEWVGGGYHITDDYYRLIIHTERGQKAMWHLFKKMVPLDAKVKLTAEEMKNVHTAIMGSEERLFGAFGPYRVKSFNNDVFLHPAEDATATKDDLSYEYEWSEL